LITPRILGITALMPKHCTSVREVISTLGGARKVAEMFGLTENAVWNWVATDRFPANTYLAIRNALRSKRRKAPDTLWRMATVADRRADSSEGAAA
jgi:hypothetical protein